MYNKKKQQLVDVKRYEYFCKARYRLNRFSYQ